jgi:hypothetical protein
MPGLALEHGGELRYGARPAAVDLRGHVEARDAHVAAVFI